MASPTITWKAGGKISRGQFSAFLCSSKSSHTRKPHRREKIAWAHSSILYMVIHHPSPVLGDDDRITTSLSHPAINYAKCTREHCSHFISFTATSDSLIDTEPKREEAKSLDEFVLRSHRLIAFSLLTGGHLRYASSRLAGKPQNLSQEGHVLWCSHHMSRRKFRERLSNANGAFNAQREGLSSH